MAERTVKDFYKKQTPVQNWLSNMLMGVGGGLTGQNYIGNAQAARQAEAELAYKEWNDTRNAPTEQIIEKGNVAEALTKQVEAGAISPQQATEQFNSMFGEARQSIQPQINPVSNPMPGQGGFLPDNRLNSATAFEGYRAEKLNAMGVPTGYEPDPVREDQMKDLQKSSTAAQKSLSGTDNFLKQFDRSYNELLKANPEIGDVGLTGFMTRKGASIQNSLDMYPETKAFMVELKPLANQMARDIEGGRVTDQDRQIYADSFANTLQHPSATNIRLVSNKLLDMKNKGANIEKVLVSLSKSNTDVMQSIVDEVLKESPELASAVFQANPDAWEVSK